MRRSAHESESTRRSSIPYAGFVQLMMSTWGDAASLPCGESIARRVRFDLFGVCAARHLRYEYSRIEYGGLPANGAAFCIRRIIARPTAGHRSLAT